MGFVEHLPDWMPTGWLLFAFAIWFTAQWIARHSLSHAPHKRAVAGWLRHPRYTQLYRWACRPVVEWFWQRVGDTSVKETVPWRKQAMGALSAKLYDKALLIAVVYPIFAALTYWLWTGNAATIGSAEIIGAEPSLKRLLTLAPFAVLIFLVWLKHHLLASQRKRGVSFTGWQDLIIQNLDLLGLFIAVSVAGPFAFVVSVAAAAATFAFAGAFAVAAAVAFSVAFADAVSVASAVAFAFAFAASVAFVEEKLPHRVYYTLHALCICALIGGLVWYVPWADASGQGRSIFVFLGVFPLINGIFDWISYWMTLSLLRRGQWAVWPFLWGLLDLIVACALFLLLGITLVSVLNGLDQLAGGTLVDLPALLGGVYALKHGDWSQSWALFMVFSTMLPTGLHVLISLIGLQGLWPTKWRRTLAGWIEEDDPSPLSQAVLPMVLGVVWAAPIVAGCAIIWALIQWGKPLLWGFFQGYFDVLMWVAQWGGVV